MFTTDGNTTSLGFAASPRPLLKRFTGTIVFSIYFLFWAACFQKQLSQMLSDWLNSNQLPWGSALIFASLVIIFQKRHNLSRTNSYFSITGLLIFTLLNIAAILFIVADLKFFTYLTIITMLAAITLTTFGWAITKAIAFPLYLLFFSIPFHVYIAEPIHKLIIDSFMNLLVLTNLPVYWQETSLLLNNKIIDFQQPIWISQYFMVCLMVISCYAWSVFKELNARIIFIISGFLLPILIVILAAYGFTLGNYYLYFENIEIVGKLFYSPVGILSTICIFGLIGLLLKPASKFDSNPLIFMRAKYKKKNNSRILPITLFICGILFFTWWFTTKLPDIYKTNYKQQITTSFPTIQNGWLGPYNTGNIDWQPQFPNAQKTQLSSYIGAEEIYYFQAYYGLNNKKVVLTAPQNSLYNTARWKLVYKKNIELTISSGQKFAVTETAISNENNKRLIWNWYTVSGINLISDTKIKILDSLRIILHLKPSLVTAIAMDFECNPEQPRKHLLNFLEQLA